jgi:hypothetical protein
MVACRGKASPAAAESGLWVRPAPWRCADAVPDALQRHWLRCPALRSDSTCAVPLCHVHMTDRGNRTCGRGGRLDGSYME